MRWLVTGAAGYIGSHAAAALAAAGNEIVALDDLSSGSPERLDAAWTFVHGSVLDAGTVRAALDGVDGLVHIAAKKQVGESVAAPLLYYRENVAGLLTLLEACVARDVRRVVFSSSAAAYGMPDVDLVQEDTPAEPISPYGTTKLIGEWMLRDAAVAHALSVVSLRYFNVAGAGSPRLGDRAVMNLIPIVFEAMTQGRRPQVYGTDYPTPDGTCIRDYVHVADIARAHVLAAEATGRTPGAVTYNIGRGEGTSVLEVLSVISAVTGLELPYDAVARRAGDPPRLVASVDKIRRELGFTAERDLTEMVSSAWAAWQHEPAR